MVAVESVLYGRRIMSHGNGEEFAAVGWELNDCGGFKR